jgi:hypothetical protein
VSTKRAATDVDVDTRKGLIRAIFSTFDVVDHDGDIVRPGAIPDGRTVISTFNHGSWDAARTPLGWGLITTSSKHAEVEAHFEMKAQHARDAFEVIRTLGEQGLQEWSYSLHGIKSTKQMIDGRSTRVITSMYLPREVSPVLAAASIGTRNLSAKADPTTNHRDQLSDADQLELQYIARTVELRNEVAALEQLIGCRR